MNCTPEKEVISRLWKIVEQAGSLPRASKILKTPYSSVEAVLAGRRKPTPHLAKMLGYRIETHYLPMQADGART